jgi:hypothetical protein
MPETKTSSNNLTRRPLPTRRKDLLLRRCNKPRLKKLDNFYQLEGLESSLNGRLRELPLDRVKTNPYQMSLGVRNNPKISGPRKKFGMMKNLTRMELTS